MNKLIFVLVILTSFVLSKSVLGQNFTITVTITGLHSNKGKVMLELYNSEEGYPKEPKKAIHIVNSAITNNTCTIVLTDIPKGTYAIACFHDENNNGKLDTSFLGIPEEGTGASNNAKGSMGPPKFKDAEFVVNKNVSMSIKIAY